MMHSLNFERVLKPQNISFSAVFHDFIKEEVNCERHMTMRLYLAGLTSKGVNFGHAKIFKITASVQSHLDFIFFFSVGHIVSYSCGLNNTLSPMMYA